MNYDVQPNGEPKKIFLAKPPPATAIITTEPTATAAAAPVMTASTPAQWRALRNSASDQVRIPPRRHQPPVDRNGDEHLSNHKKQRYWNSWEELYLVELWRRYKDELTTVNVPLPVYRKMMIAMRNRNMVVTAQDCRRKINTINSRYKQELTRMESSGCKSEWRLFPLVHCVLLPKIKEYDPWHENRIIKKLLDKIPRPKEMDVPSTVINSNSSSNHYNASTRSLTTSSLLHTSYQQRTSYQTLQHSTLNASAVYTDMNSPYNRLSAQPARLDKISILPFRNITLEKIEQLRQDNNRLAEQRDADLKSLHLEEENFQCFQTFIRIWTEQKESELRRIQHLSKHSVINIENEENHSVEQHQQQQQLQETIVAK